MTSHTVLNFISSSTSASRATYSVAIHLMLSSLMTANSSTTLLQYVDNLLLYSSSHYNYLVHTVTVLNALGNWGYRVSLQSTIASTTGSYMDSSPPTSKIIPAPRLEPWPLNPQAPKRKRGLLFLLGLLNF